MPRLHLVAFFSAILWCPFNTAEAQDLSEIAVGPEITVGFILPLTGGAATFGVPLKNGVELAYGKLSPEMKKKIKIIYEDDANTPKMTVSAFQKLISADNVDVIVTAASNTSKAIAQLADSKKLPVIAIASDQEVVEGRTHVVALWVTPDAEAKLLVPEAQRRGYQKIAVISAVHDGTLSFKRAFEEHNTGKLKVLLNEEYSTDATDFKPFLNKLRSAGEVDAIFANLFPGQIGTFARQAREAGISVPLFGVEMFENPDDVKLSQGALVGQWYAQADEGTSGFLREYREKYPTAITFAAANGHDAVGLIADAVGAGKTDKAAINDHLHAVKNYSGALGTYSATPDNRFNLPATLKIVTKDGFEKLNSPDS